MKNHLGKTPEKPYWGVGDGGMGGGGAGTQPPLVRPRVKQFNFILNLACVANPSVGYSTRLKHFSFFFPRN